VERKVVEILSPDENLREIGKDLLVLPVSYHVGGVSDAVSDLLVSQAESEKVSSSEDCRRLVSDYISKNLPQLGEQVKNRILEATVSNILLYLTSNLPKKMKGLQEALKPREKKQLIKKTLVVGKNAGFVVRVPAFNEDDKSQIEILSKYLHWGLTMTGVDPSKVKILKDKDYGDSLHITKKVEDAMDKTIAALHLDGNPLECFQFWTGLKATLPETIAALRVLRENSAKVTRTSPKTKPLTGTQLRENLNIRFGLNEPKVPDFTKIYVKAVLNEITKPTSLLLPGKFIHSLKEQNKKSSKTGLLALMGYSARAVPYSKTLFLLKDRVTTEQVLDSGKKGSGKEIYTTRKVLKDFSNEKFPLGRNLREARLAVATGLPYVSPKSKKTIKEQLMVDQMSPEATQAMRFYVENRKLASAINTAYAVKVTLGKKGSKSTIKSYENALNRVLRLSAKNTFMDADGTKYDSFYDVPQNMRESILKSIGGYKPKMDQRKKCADQIEAYVKADKPIPGDLKSPSESTSFTTYVMELLADDFDDQSYTKHKAAFSTDAFYCVECLRGGDFCVDEKIHYDPRVGCNCDSDDEEEPPEEEDLKENE
jgi:hypothetical protein